MKIHQQTAAYALATAFFSIILAIVLFMSGLVMSAWNYLSYAAYVVLLVYGLKSWREKAGQGYMSYGKAMGFSFWMSAYYSLIIAVWTYVFFSWIADQEYARFCSEQLAAQEQMIRNMPDLKFSEVQIEQQLKMTSRFMQPGLTSVMAFFMNMFLLTIIGLIVSAILKKDKPLPVSNINAQ